MLHPARLTLNDERPVFVAADAFKRVSKWYYGTARVERAEACRLTDWINDSSESALASRGMIVIGEWIGDVLFFTERFGTPNRATNRIAPDKDGLYELPGRDIWQWTYVDEPSTPWPISPTRFRRAERSSRGGTRPTQNTRRRARSEHNHRHRVRHACPQAVFRPHIKVYVHQKKLTCGNAATLTDVRTSVQTRSDHV